MSMHTEIQKIAESHRTQREMIRSQLARLERELEALNAAQNAQIASFVRVARPGFKAVQVASGDSSKFGLDVAADAGDWLIVPTDWPDGRITAHNSSRETTVSVENSDGQRIARMTSILHYGEESEDAAWAAFGEVETDEIDDALRSIEY